MPTASAAANTKPPVSSRLRSILAATPISSLAKRWPASRLTWRSAFSKQAAYPPAKSCSGLVASPLPPRARGSASSRASRPSSLRIEPWRPPLAATFVEYRLAIVNMPSSLGFANLRPVSGPSPRHVGEPPVREGQRFGPLARAVRARRYPGKDYSPPPLRPFLTKSPDLLDSFAEDCLGCA